MSNDRDIVQDGAVDAVQLHPAVQETVDEIRLSLMQARHLNGPCTEASEMLEDALGSQHEARVRIFSYLPYQVHVSFYNLDALRDAQAFRSELVSRGYRQILPRRIADGSIHWVHSLGRVACMDVSLHLDAYGIGLSGNCELVEVGEEKTVSVKKVYKLVCGGGELEDDFSEEVPDDISNGQ